MYKSLLLTGAKRQLNHIQRTQNYLNTTSWKCLSIQISKKEDILHHIQRLKLVRKKIQHGCMPVTTSNLR